MPEPRREAAGARIEALNAELRQALDEHQAINEELRCANEELEASREQMQAINERLSLANAELGHRHDELVALNSDFRNLLDSTQIATLFLDPRLRIKAFTPNMAELFTLLPHDVGRSITELRSTLDYRHLPADVEEVMRELSVMEREVQSLGGDARVFLLRLRPYRRLDESVDGVVLTFIDITARKQAEDQVRFLAHHDPLTGLANRAMFHAALERDLTGAAATEHATCLFYLDLDRFKAVNDNFGHRVGDRLLQLVAERLRRCVRAEDLVCRLGGDEFAIVQHGIRHPDDTSGLADRILASIAAPFDIDGHAVTIGVSIGIAMRGRDETDAEALPRAADIALYDAKARGRGNRQMFRPEMLERRQLRRQMERDLREAVARDQFVLLYQPLVRLSDRRIVGAEALLRWRHQALGLLQPGRFISVAEESGSIVPIGAWVLRTACAAAALWPAPLGLSVNLSSAQFADRELAGMVGGALGDAGLPPGRLALEVTETVLLQDDLRTQETLASLREIGVRIAMDDFGTGYSSLSYLHSFPIDKIKIDKAFTQTLESRRESAMIVKAVVAIGEGLEIAVCAEGVETEAQITALQRLGVVEAQGFHLHRPMPAAAFAALVGG